MARYLGPICRKARRFGVDMGGLKGLRDLKSKCKLELLPGQHGAGKKRSSDYKVQLLEKQKLKTMYHVLERSFRLYFKEASRREGATGEILLQLLESRLDNVVYRAGLASTRAEAGQLVSHGAITVNGKRVNIRSFLVRADDIVSVMPKAQKQTRIKEALELAKNRVQVSDWISVEAANFNVTFKRVPDRSELPADINEQLVVELYSKIM